MRNKRAELLYRIDLHVSMPSLLGQTFTLPSSLHADTRTNSMLEYRDFTLSDKCTAAMENQALSEANTCDAYRNLTDRCLPDS